MVNISSGNQSCGISVLGTSKRHIWCYVHGNCCKWRKPFWDSVDKSNSTRWWWSSLVLLLVSTEFGWKFSRLLDLEMFYFMANTIQDFSPVDFFPWDRLEYIIYCAPPASLEDLRQWITDPSPETLYKVRKLVWKNLYESWKERRKRGLLMWCDKQLAALHIHRFFPVKHLCFFYKLHVHTKNCTLRFIEFKQLSNNVWLALLSCFTGWSPHTVRGLNLEK